jgi:metal-responsive CopG/Arc/MetJ family transcriptional regulator
LKGGIGENMKIKINVTIEESIVESVDRWAKEFELNRSQMVQNLLSASLADVRLLKKLGLVDLAAIVSRVQKRWQENLKTA